ncbi:hypothetical protein D8825_04630 [Streptococcus intermedius]|jgi:conserved domain protein|nr:hypothetical protein D8825_04630 [Streptococcus intermedius]
MAKKSNANIGFEKELWDAADSLRGHISASEYRKVMRKAKSLKMKIFKYKML